MLDGFLLACIEFGLVLLHDRDINTLIFLAKKISFTTAAPVVLVIGGIVLNVLFLHRGTQANNDPVSPLLVADALAAFVPESDSFEADNVFHGDFNVSTEEDETAGFIVVEGDSLLNSSNPLSTILPNRDGLLTYKVQKGDTLSKIAANFGISVNTIFWANNKIGSSIRPGQELVILPVSGVAHRVDEGETLDSIADLYSVSRDKILQYNKRVLSKPLAAGSVLVIPGAKPKKSLATAAIEKLPSYPGYFILPTTGLNWGQLHHYNAVDVANACGTPIYASAEGLVTASMSYGYNDGYGHYVDIEHPNGVITRYAHMEKNTVAVGDYVAQGDQIGNIGNTGKTHGPTGCHLHFEIKGARNPFSK